MRHARRQHAGPHRRHLGSGARGNQGDDAAAERRLVLQHAAVRVDSQVDALSGEAESEARGDARCDVAAEHRRRQQHHTRTIRGDDLAQQRRERFDAGGVAIVFGQQDALRAVGRERVDMLRRAGAGDQHADRSAECAGQLDRLVQQLERHWPQCGVPWLAAHSKAPHLFRDDQHVARALALYDRRRCRRRRRAAPGGPGAEQAMTEQACHQHLDRRVRTSRLDHLAPALVLDRLRDRAPRWATRRRRIGSRRRRGRLR